MLGKFFCLVNVCIFCSIGAFAQTPTSTPVSVKTPIPASGQSSLPNESTSLAPKTPATPTLEMILNEAEKQTANYRNEFKNLLATETKTFVQYGKNGNLKNQSAIESNFFVYQSSKVENVTSELRNVTKADGKLVPDSQARADRLLAELEKVKTIENELEKIQNEGSRYDKTLKTNGLTLFEAIALSDNLRPYFDFKLLGTENYAGNEVFVVAFQQTKKSPFISVNEKDTTEQGIKASFDVGLPGALKKSDVFLRGKLWIDAKTFQIWREERQLAVQTANPVVVVETIFDYQSSEYGILVPKQISLVQNAVKKNPKENEYAAVNETKINFEYSKFKKYNTDVQILDDN